MLKLWMAMITRRAQVEGNGRSFISLIGDSSPLSLCACLEFVTEYSRTVRCAALCALQYLWSIC